MVQSVDIVKYTDEEYEKYLNDPVCINLRLHHFNFLFLYLIARHLLIRQKRQIHIYRCTCHDFSFKRYKSIHSFANVC